MTQRVTLDLDKIRGGTLNVSPHLYFKKKNVYICSMNSFSKIMISVILFCIALVSVVLTILFVGMVIALLSAADSSLFEICEYIFLNV